MHIVTYNYALATPELGPPYRTNHLAEEWVRMGHKATVVGSSFSHLLYRAAEFDGSVKVETVNGVRYVLLKVPTYRGSGVKRVLNFLAAMRGAKRHARLIADDESPALVIAGSVYQTDNYAAHALAQAHGGVFFRETRDLWPMTLLEVGKMSPGHPLVRFIQRAEDHGFRYADRVVSTLEASYAYMGTRGLPKERWHYSPQFGASEAERSDPSKLPAEHRAVISALREAGAFVAVYAGSIGPVYDFPNLLKAAALVKGDGIAVVFVGDGPTRPELQSLCLEMNLDNVRFLDKIPKQAVAPLLELADAGLMGFHDIKLYRYGTSPNKLVDYAQAAIPQVFYTNATHSLTSSAECGLVVPPSDPEALANALRRLRDMSPEERRAMGERGRAYVREHCTVEAVARDYLRLYEEARAEKARTSR
ncbi:MAG: glycosyltransferase family 4 protein [Fimbriimonadaceae bacterium]|nr:glycosyltransferase family 4 protein [Fimbriimonadaceae bacterium]